MQIMIRNAKLSFKKQYLREGRDKNLIATLSAVLLLVTMISRQKKRDFY